MRPARLLIIDDEADICQLLAEALAGDGRQVDWTTAPLEALERVKSSPCELVLLDIKMPEISGLDLLPRLKQASPGTAVLVMSAFGNISMAVEAMKRGAEDYLEKPFGDLEVVRLAASRLIESAAVRLENRTLRRQLAEKFQLDGLVSASPRMQETFAMVRKVAPLATTVLITGETGTGKERIARILHQNSPRAKGPFVSVNCGGLPEGLLESLLFGHEKGAFTGAARRTRGYFEEADGGSLFLDEIGDMPPALQVKILRTLQERSFQRLGSSEEILVDLRLIAATHRNLEEEVRRGTFRQDLLYRINVITVALPPLRDRREDIPLLARYFVEKYAAAFSRPARELTREALHYLCHRDWPGNVRQLENVIERAVALSSGPRLGLEDFSESLAAPADDFLVRLLQSPLREARRLFERHYLLENLRRYGGNVTQAARRAGLPRQNYHRKMKELGLRTVSRMDFTPAEAESEPA
ncbi:MAG: sigma-54-dependent Fis family transcriptional regulator [Candidatus Zixiibacteriota bacterium]|nr:MAG: sigma-54-dependent Fis family transcriptional regulator [candidate division Zixibacteria bacterium]